MDLHYRHSNNSPAPRHRARGIRVRDAGQTLAPYSVSTAYSDGLRGVGAELDPSGDAAVDGHVEVDVVPRVDLDVDALPGAGLGGVDHLLHDPHGHPGERSRTAGVVQRPPGFLDVGDAVLELVEDVGAVVDAESVSRAQVLIDPHPHAPTSL